jgi:hypothetical protein
MGEKRIVKKSDGALIFSEEEVSVLLPDEVKSVRFVLIAALMYLFQTQNSEFTELLKSAYDEACKNPEIFEIVKIKPTPKSKSKKK